VAREITFDGRGWQDYLHWQTQDRKTLKRINQLLNETLRAPFTGTGKPEPLKGDLSGLWSRRIDDKNRLVYLVEEFRIVVFNCRGHYDEK
jgi:toxin YoeB